MRANGRDALQQHGKLDFDFDAAGDEDRLLQQPASFCVSDLVAGRGYLAALLSIPLYRRSWQDYYEKAQLTAAQASALSHHALGTISIDIPMLLAFFLLFAARPGLPRRPLMPRASQ